MSIAIGMGNKAQALISLLCKEPFIDELRSLSVTRQRPPTMQGYAFLALQAPTGLVNVVIAPQVYAQYREAIHSTFVIVEGVVQKDHGAINVVAAQVRAI